MILLYDLVTLNKRKLMEKSKLRKVVYHSMRLEGYKVKLNEKN